MEVTWARRKMHAGLVRARMSFAHPWHHEFNLLAIEDERFYRNVLSKKWIAAMSSFVNCEGAAR